MSNSSSSFWPFSVFLDIQGQITLNTNNLVLFASAADQIMFVTIVGYECS